MISPKPNTPAWSVLALVVAHPGELDAESIGQRLWLALPATPPPPVSRGFADPMSHPGRRAWFDALNAGPRLAVRASTYLSRLTAAGFVAPEKAPILHPAVVTPPDTHLRQIREWARDAVSGFEDPAGRNVVDLLVSLVTDAPPTLKRWAGSSPSGARWRAVVALVENEIVIPPSFRFPTDRGIALVEGGAP